MQQVKIDHLGPQSTQAAFAGFRQGSRGWHCADRPWSREKRFRADPRSPPPRPLPRRLRHTSRRCRSASSRARSRAARRRLPARDARSRSPIFQVPCPRIGTRISASQRHIIFMRRTCTQKTRSSGEAERDASSLCLTNYCLTISAFSSIDMPPLLAILPFKVTVLPARGASSSFIGLCAPTTR